MLRCRIDAAFRNAASMRRERGQEKFVLCPRLGRLFLGIEEPLQMADAGGGGAVCATLWLRSVGCASRVTFVHLADLFQGALVAVHEPKRISRIFPLALGQAGEDIAQFLFEKAGSWSRPRGSRRSCLR